MELGPRGRGHMERAQHNIKIKLLDIPWLKTDEQELHRCLARRAELQRTSRLTALERPYFAEAVTFYL